MKTYFNQAHNVVRQNKKSVFTDAEKNRAIEIANLISQLPEQEQKKIYYMLIGSEIFNGRTDCAVDSA